MVLLLRHCPTICRVVPHKCISMEEWKNWMSLPFKERYRLPSCSGIYVVADNKDYVLYVGQAINLRNRWSGRAHHRYTQLSRSHKKKEYKIHWLSVPSLELNEKENYYIELFRPELNGTRVKKHLPSVPQVDREIIRLLKVLNHKTLLFPNIRSLVIGTYINDEGRQSIVIVNNYNDESLIFNSIKKKYSRQIRNSWTWLENGCGWDESKYAPVLYPIYMWGQYNFEFVTINWKWFKYLEEYPQNTIQIELLGASVRSLSNFDAISNFNFEEVWGLKDAEGREKLRHEAYLVYRRNFLSLCK